MCHKECSKSTFRALSENHSVKYFYSFNPLTENKMASKLIFAAKSLFSSIEYISYKPVKSKPETNRALSNSFSTNRAKTNGRLDLNMQAHMQCKCSLLYILTGVIFMFGYFHYSSIRAV